MNAPHKSDPPNLADLPDLAERPSFFGTGVIYPAGAKNEAERRVALERLFELAETIANSAEPEDHEKMTRDEMHER